jgi:CHAD domain-containing protein
MAKNFIETEAKYEAEADVALPELAGLPGVAGVAGPVSQHLEADYYDTEDLRLIRAGITLRRRTGGDDAGWHLKLPAGPLTRQEIRRPLGEGAHRIPAELAGLVRAHTRGARLRRVASIVTERQQLTLLDEGGRPLAEVADDSVAAVAAASGPGPASTWREVEVELAGGDAGLLKSADSVLRAAGLRQAGRSAKLERALSVELVGRQPARRHPVRLTGRTPAVRVVQSYLREQLGVLISLDPAVRQDEPDAVHQMRVTTRRLRSALRTFADMAGPQASELAAELKWLGALLGAARDAEVLSEHLRDSLRQLPPEQVLGPVMARVQAHFASSGARARRAAVRALDSRRYLALLDGLEQVTTQLADAPSGGPDEAIAAAALPPAISRDYRRTRNRMRRADQLPPGPARDAALHQVRKAAKRARYAAEVAGPAIGSPAYRFSARMRKVQSVLGDLQDTVVAREAERALAIEAHRAGENAFSYGVLYGLDGEAGRRLAARARRAWRKSARRRYRRWLG